MKLLNTLAHPLIIALLCIPLMQLALLLPNFLVVFVAFQCWALYFLAGANLKSGVRAAVCYILGELFAIGIIEMATATGGVFGNWALTIAVALAAGLIILLAEGVKPVEVVPAYFIGAGAFFAFYKGQGYPFAVASVAFSMIVGFILGFLTIFLYGQWSAFTKRQAAKTPTAPSGVASAKS